MKAKDKILLSILCSFDFFGCITKVQRVEEKSFTGSLSVANGMMFFNPCSSPSPLPFGYPVRTGRSAAGEIKKMCLRSNTIYFMSCSGNFVVNDDPLYTKAFELRHVTEIRKPLSTDCNFSSDGSF